MFFAVAMDFYTRKVIGWAGSRNRNASLTKSALLMALNHHSRQPGCLFHSDQGVEYAAQEFREAVQRKVYRNEIEAMSELIMYVNFYNQERLHSALDYQSPLNYEKLCA